MAIAQEGLETGREVAAVSAGTLSAALRAGIERYVGWPYQVASASIVDADGTVSDTFAAVVYAAKEKSLGAAPAQIPADSAAVVVDAIHSLTIDNFRAAYARIARAKRLRKSPAPNLDAPTDSDNHCGLTPSQASPYSSCAR